MKRVLSGLVVSLLVVSASTACFADLQYTEESKITGGAAAGAMKFAGMFSKDARQATHGTTATISVKGNKMRRETSLGTAEIYDLDARRMVSIDLKHKTYSVVTFDELRAQIQEAKRKAAEEQAKRQKGKSDAQVKITPKIKITPGSNTRHILDYNTKEVKTQVEMLIESQDPKQKGDSANTWVNSDAYVATVKGHEELTRFYTKMARELDWLPGEVFGNGNAQINQPMVEYRKSVASMNGMPLLSYVSVGMGPNPGTTGQAAAAEPTPEEKKGNVVAKGLGGMFGGMGKHKSKDESEDQQKGSAQTASLMDMTMQVTSLSNKPVDASLFAIPAGFKQVEPRKEAR